MSTACGQVQGDPLERSPGGDASGEVPDDGSPQEEPFANACADTCATHAACVNGSCVDLLSGLSVSASSLAFTSATTDYTLDVSITQETLTVTATSIAGGVLRIKGVDARSGQPSAPIALALGETLVDVTVTLGARQATYTLHVTRAANVVQRMYGKALNAEAGDNLGTLAMDGDTLVVGAPGEEGDATSTMSAPNNAASGAGAVYVFVRDGATWTQQAYLKAANAEADDYFGISVAVHGDTIVVGAREEDGDATSTMGAPNNAATGAGAAYVFVRDGTTWSQQAYLKAANAEMYDNFGARVAVHGDTIVVGATGEDGDATSTMGAPNNAASNAGAAYVFVRDGTTWLQQAYLKAEVTWTIYGNYDGNIFGSSLAVDGDTIVVGARWEGEYLAGAAYVFVRDGGVWSRQASLRHTDNRNALFGYSVALRGDTIVIGAPAMEAVFVFVRDGTAWSRQASINAAHNADGLLSEFFGGAVAMDGGTIVVGAVNEDGGGTRAGAAYVFVRDGTAWSQQAYLKAPNAEAGDNFGASVAVRGDTIVVGAWSEDGDATSTMSAPNNAAPNAGAFYIMSL